MTNATQLTRCVLVWLSLIMKEACQFAEKLKTHVIQLAVEDCVQLKSKFANALAMMLLGRINF